MENDQKKHCDRVISGLDHPAGNLAQSILRHELLHEWKQDMVFLVDVVHEPLDNALGGGLKVESCSLAFFFPVELVHGLAQLDILLLKELVVLAHQPGGSLNIALQNREKGFFLPLVMHAYFNLDKAERSSDLVECVY